MKNDGAPGFFRGRPTQTLHDSINKGVNTYPLSCRLELCRTRTDSTEGQDSKKLNKNIKNEI